jgi:hypothetical protein
MVIYVAAKIRILQGWGIDWVSKCGTLKQFNTAMAAGAFYFCRNKSNKNAFFDLGFFAAQGQPCKSGRTTGCKKLLHFVRSLPHASANICYALCRPQAPMFCLISSEASC